MTGTDIAALLMVAMICATAIIITYMRRNHY